MTARDGAQAGQVRLALFVVLAMGLVFSSAAAFMAGLRMAISVAVGAALAAINIVALSRTVRASLANEDAATARASSVAVMNLLKLLGELALMWLLIRWGLLSPLGLAAGIAALPVGILITTLAQAPHPR